MQPSTEPLSGGQTIQGHSVNEISYPQNFDLRIIHLREGSDHIHEEVATILAGLCVPFTVMQTVRKDETGKYAKTGVRVSVPSKETMDAMYAGISKLPYVKAMI